ncbi:Major Facilitator Superfamily protein [compost metagenome]
MIIGIGQALVFTTMFIAGSTGIDPKEQGVASAMISTGQQIGGAVGLAVIMAIISASLGSSTTLESMAAADLNQAIHTAFLIAAGVTALAILVALSTLRQKKTTEVNTQLPTSN